MQKIINFTKKASQHRFARYVFVGSTTFAIDIGLFSLLHAVWGWDLLLSNTISYWTAIAFNFTANRSWTFDDAKKVGIARNLSLYLTLLVFNFAFSSLFLAVATSLGTNPQLAKIAATALQTLWTYLAYNRIVFRSHDPKD